MPLGGDCAVDHLGSSEISRTGIEPSLPSRLHFPTRPLGGAGATRAAPAAGPRTSPGPPGNPWGFILQGALPCWSGVLGHLATSLATGA